MGTGYASGRATGGRIGGDAGRAINSPLLEGRDPRPAPRGLLVNITGGPTASPSSR